MKTKLVFITLLLSMCSNQTQESDDIRIISLSTTHTEIIYSLEAQDTLVAVDAFSEADTSIKKIDAYTVTAEELTPLDADVVILAFDFNGIVQGLEKKGIPYILLPPAKNFEDVYMQIETVGALVNKESLASSIVEEMKTKINKIFENANFGIEKGEFVCIIGHSGCGKSTILNVLAGLDEASSGVVIMEGREVSGPRNRGRDLHLDR